MIVEDRLAELNLMISPDQNPTPADGNCQIWALIDQCSRDPIWKNYYGSQTIDNVQKMR